VKNHIDMSWHLDHPELLNVCDVRGEGDNARYSVNPDKLGTAILAYDPAELEANNRNGVFRPVEWFPLSQTASTKYDRVKHAHLKLCTVSTDPNVVYPESLRVSSMHRFSSSKTTPSKEGECAAKASMPPLKGVKTLHIRSVNSSLDFTSTGVEHLIIESVSLASHPDRLNDYDIVFPQAEFSLGYSNPACTISCNATIEVHYSNPHFAVDSNGKKLGSAGLTYNCKTLIIDQGVDGFTSSCEALMLRPSFKFQGDTGFSFITPNLRYSWVRAATTSDDAGGNKIGC